MKLSQEDQHPIERQTNAFGDNFKLRVTDTPVHKRKKLPAECGLSTNGIVGGFPIIICDPSKNNSVKLRRKSLEKACLPSTPERSSTPRRRRDNLYNHSNHSSRRRQKGSRQASGDSLLSVRTEDTAAMSYTDDKNEEVEEESTSTHKSRRRSSIEEPASFSAPSQANVEVRSRRARSKDPAPSHSASDGATSRRGQQSLDVARRRRRDRKSKELNNEEDASPNEKPAVDTEEDSSKPERRRARIKEIAMERHRARSKDKPSKRSSQDEAKAGEGSMRRHRRAMSKEKPTKKRIEDEKKKVETASESNNEENTKEPRRSSKKKDGEDALKRKERKPSHSKKQDKEESKRKERKSTKEADEGESEQKELKVRSKEEGSRPNDPKPLKKQDDPEGSKRNERKSSIKQDEAENENVFYLPESGATGGKKRSLSGWELRETMKKSATGGFRSPLAGSRSPSKSTINSGTPAAFLSPLPGSSSHSKSTVKSSTSPNTSSNYAINSSQHSKTNYLSSHSKCTNSSSMHSSDDEDNDGGFNIVKSSSSKWFKLRTGALNDNSIDTNATTTPTRIAMTPVSSAKRKVELNATTPLSVKSELPVSKWAKVKHANNFVKKTKKQAEESRQIVNSFGSPTKVAAWQMRERAKQGGAGGRRCESEASIAELPPAFQSIQRRSRSVPYVMGRKALSNRKQESRARRSSILDAVTSFCCDDSNDPAAWEAKLEVKNGKTRVVVELGGDCTVSSVLLI